MIGELPQNVITIQKNLKIPEIYDVELENINQFHQYSTLECHIVLYPYSRRIRGTHITFRPFEEYIKDILSSKRSVYIKVTSEFHRVFGLILGGAIALLFYFLKPEDLFSVQSVVSIFVAYTIGKEFWSDTERMLVSISKNWRIRYMEPYFTYELEKHTTLTHYVRLARKRRYGKVHLLPEKMGFIQQSNSQTVRMRFNVKELPPLEGPARILSVALDPGVIGHFEDEQFLFGVKLSLNKKFLCFSKCFELYQSLDRGSKGCLDEEGEWIPDGVFYRETFVFRRVKWFKKAGIIPGKSMVKVTIDDGL